VEWFDLGEEQFDGNGAGTGSLASQ